MRFKTFAAVLGLACVCVAPAAEAEKEKHTAYLGMTREQLFAKLGDPRNLMKAGPREIMFFPHLKLTLRNGVVVETEAVLDDVPVAPPPAPVTAPARRAGAESVPSAPAAAAAADTNDSPAAKKTSAAAAAEAPATKSAAAAGSVATEAAPAAPAPGVEIKSVRQPTANAPRPAARSVAPKAVEPVPAAKTTVSAAPTTSSPAAAAAAAPAPKASPAPTSPAPTPTVTAPVVASVPAQTSTPSTPAPAETVVAPEKPVETVAEAEVPDTKKQKAAARRSLFRRQTAGDDDLPEPTIFTAQTYVFGAALLGAIAYLVWRRRQRSLELAATTVSSTPFDEKIPVDNSAMFDAAILAKLEWKRFEELVAAYYVKTGVVAVRTNTGPESPVHLKISWKGEAKPFAGVQCHCNPTGLIRSGPLQQLFDALNAADIRRGYVVTNGKFNVEARDLASEKHFTLLSGDILIEKLNALPPPARAELMQEILKGDYSTPTCPKCDVKMVRADETTWRCVNHPRCEQTIPPRKT